MARTASFTAAEWEAYDRAKMAEQDARGAAIVAHMEGVEEGRRTMLREAMEGLCDVLGEPLSPERRTALTQMAEPDLRALFDRLRRERRW